MNELDYSKYPKELHPLLDEIVGMCEACDETVVFCDDYEGGLIGWCDGPGGHPIAVYDYDKSIMYLAETYYAGKDENGNPNYASLDDAISAAIEWYEYNTVRSLPYINHEDGSNVAPLFIHTLQAN